MAKIHVLDAYRDTSYVARLAADLANLLAIEPGDLVFSKSSLRTESVRLRKQADLLHYLWLNIQLQMDRLEENPNITPQDIDGMRRSVQNAGAVIEDLVKNIQNKTSSMFE